MRQFEAGMQGTTEPSSSMRFRVVEGRKRPGDLVVEWLTPAGWEPVPMRAVGMLHAFFVENEDHLYPRAQGFLGGDYWRAFLVLCEDDWRSASKKLAQEKAQAARRRAGVA